MMFVSQIKPHSQKAALEGLEPLFETVTTTPTDTVTNTHNTIVAVTGTPLDWTLKEAVEHLGISANTIRNRIKTGELQGSKVPGVNGPEWRITPPEDTLTNAPPKLEGLQAVLQIIDSQARQIDMMSKHLDANTVQLKAAGDVVTYLHEQLRARDSQIKLLTDSQQKPSWWKRFCSWFQPA